MIPSFKIKLTFYSLLLFFVSSNTMAQNFSNGFEYMDFIGKEFKQISTDMWDYTSAAAHGKKARTVENRRKELVGQITKSIKKIEKLQGFNGNTSYRDSVLSYLNLNKLVLNDDYAKIVDMEEIAEQSYDAIEAYMLAKQKAEEKQQHAGDMIDVEERKFAAANNINLIESNDKIGKKLEEAGKVYKYYNEIYLIFFKSYKQELYLIDAQNKADLNAMEQSKNALTKSCQEGKTKLEKVSDYKGDLSVKKACADMLDFYESEAAKFSDITKYYINKEKFDKINASFEAKSQSQRTKADVDQFNAAVNELNEASNKYNAINQDLNQNRTKYLNKWNNDSDRLIDKFVPKRKK